MSATAREVHVYADGEPAELHVVPVVRLAAGIWVEAEPVAALAVASDRARAASQLAGLLDSAAAISAQRAGARDVNRWDGGSLWERNRLFVAVEWRSDRISVKPQQSLESPELPLPEWEPASEENLPPDAPADAVAQTILGFLDRTPAAP